MKKDPSDDTNSKNEYSYANPYQTDKWTLQGIALGLRQESAYATVNDLDCHGDFGVNSDYSEINCGRFIVDSYHLLLKTCDFFSRI